MVRWLVPRLIKLVFLFFEKTIRWDVVGKAPVKGDAECYLYAFWHARLLMIPKLSRNIWHGYMLISEHRDGGFISDALLLLGLETIRGSSSRGGARAMLQMLRAVKNENRSLGVTPDGPRGPREKIKKGTVQLAMKSGLPFVPVCYATKGHWRINSWDRFYIPKPFTRGVFIIAEGIKVHDDEDFNEAFARLQQAMDDAQRQADAYFS
ncbi:MAG: lysophospholipid acyltransferase family protein [Mariprofundaceae bacterium]